MKEYLENRIKQLKEADVRACEHRWDMTKSQAERSIWREQSNEITARRHELEEALRFLNSGNEIGVSDAQEHGALHAVGGSHTGTGDDNTQEPKASVAGALEERTDDGNYCPSCSRNNGVLVRGNAIKCSCGHMYIPRAIMKSS
jgi:hypothetical protein